MSLWDNVNVFGRFIKPLFYNTSTPPTNGALIRYNTSTSSWESCAEPISFNGIRLNPQASPSEELEGDIYYKESDNGIYVATE
jgi:hypothetical protein